MKEEVLRFDVVRSCGPDGVLMSSDSAPAPARRTFEDDGICGADAARLTYDQLKSVMSLPIAARQAYVDTALGRERKPAPGNSDAPKPVGDPLRPSERNKRRTPALQHLDANYSRSFSERAAADDSKEKNRTAQESADWFAKGGQHRAEAEAAAEHGHSISGTGDGLLKRMNEAYRRSFKRDAEGEE